MLNSTFLHLPGIGQLREERLWAQQKYTWDDLLTSQRQLELFPIRSEPGLRRAIDESRLAFERRDANYFATHLPSREHYRIALGFPSDVAFLDIETTGLSLYYDRITLVGVYMNGEYRCFIDGQSIEPVKELLVEARSVVTFNGSLFDLPFLRRSFPNLIIPKAHIDLRFLGRRVGLTGGQKAIEAQVGIRREGDISTITGENAPGLYHDYRRGDVNALRTLVQYNFADVTGMPKLLDIALSRLEGPQTSVPAFVARKQFALDTTAALRFARSPESVRKNQIFLYPYQAPRQARMTLRALRFPGAAVSQPIFVGIDLTGSERRPSGWAVLKDRSVFTKRLGSDDEIVDATVNVNATVVSIDSPLSLPRGRTSVTDDDPARKTAGIMRECERTLKKRGVNVYPSLIPSMQSLTKRGIALATRFRSLGLPVIESFPGAAQDIMGIPRKRTSLDQLRLGLQEFGLSGPFEHEPLSHDELDAITSAVVGAFFWSGHFEALGNEDEDYLIIPNLRADNEYWRHRRVLGLSGPIDAGKTTGATYLRDNHGWLYARFSEVLAEELKRRGKPVTRQSLQRFGQKVNREGRQRWLAHGVANRVKCAKSAVIDGLRFPDDVATLVERFGPRFALVYVDSPEAIRRERYVMEGFSADDFSAAAGHPVEQAVPDLRKFAAVTIENSSTKETYHESLLAAVYSVLAESADEPGDTRG
ncbi:MAG: DUF429 domain-containing protein [Alphaproteobacteria bacterium]|nr:DUF429 domain-containing protein [Alphaproteobacteria bacterium]